MLRKKILNNNVRSNERKNTMGIWLFLGIIVAWVLLQAYILPKFGIST